MQSLLRAGLAVAGRWALGATFSVAAWWFLAPTAAVALELTGRVTDAGGSVIVGARVELQRVPSFYDRALEILDGKSDWATAATVGTSADGAYRLQVPEPGMWQVEVSAAGKIPRRCRLLPVLHDETLPDAVLKKDVGFEVRIESDEGSPLAGAQVWVRSLEDRSKSTRRPGVRAFHAWADTGRYGRTGDDGRVGLALEQGRKARIYAFATGFLPAVSADVDTRDTTLRLQRGKPVVVRLRTASGNPVTAAVVTVSPVNWVAEAPDESGEVRLFVAPDQPLKVMLREANGRIETTELLVSAADLADQLDTEIVREWRLPEEVVLAGRVVDLETREEIQNALLWSPGDVGAVTRSSAKGRYVLRQGSRESWVIQAAAPGYGRERVEVLRQPEGPRVPTIALERTSDLVGRVVDRDGEGIVDVAVKVTHENQMLLAWTVEGGGFRLEGLIPGRSYELAAKARGYAPAYQRWSFEAGRELEMVLEPGQSIVGRLVNPDQEPVAAARVYLTPVETDPRLRSFSSRTERLPRAESGADGRFRLDDVPARPMALVARSEGLADAVLRELELVEGSGPLDLGEIELDWGVTLRGVVRSRDGEPVEGAELKVHGSGWDPVMQAIRSEENWQRTVTTDVEGRFRIEGLTGDRRLSGSVSHKDFVHRWIAEFDLGTEDPLEIVLDKGARVAGRVLDETGAPVERVRVEAKTIAPEKPLARMAMRGSGAESGFSGPDGSFEIERIAPGRVEIHVGSGSGWIVSEPLSLELSGGEERRDVMVRVSSGAELMGAVADGEGRPIAGATITVSERSSSYFNSFAASTTQRAFGRGETDGDGFYLIRGIDSKSEQMVVSAYHRGFAPLEETVEMRPGTNRLDLVLGQGVTLSGVVVTETGEPVGGAQIELSTISTSMGHTMSQGQQPVESGLDGSFRLGGLTAGSHRVQARKSGFAESAPQTVAADGGHEIRVTLTLRRGGTIRGRILGLEPDQLDQFELMAAGEEQMAMGVIGQDAEYRVSNVGFSEGRVIASSQSSGRMVSEAFSLDPRGGETWVDLEFGDGARLGGTVLRNGEPWPQVQVLAQSDNENFGSSTTDAGGRFRIEDLKDGLYQVMVLAMGTTSHSEAVRVAGDIEIQIDIATGRVSGRVVAEEDRRPVAGAVVMAAVDGDLPTAFLGQRTMTSTTGDFEIEVPVGVRVSLRAQAPGFAEGSIELDTSAGSEISGVELVLAGGDELELNVRLWTGASPALLSVALVDASGNRVLADALTGHPPGRFRLSSAPPGSWTLLLAADQAAVTSQTVTIPGSPVEVVLQQGATVQVQISDSIEAGDAKFRLLASNGAVLVFPAFGAVLTEIPFVASAGMIPFVPAGDWVVELIGSSGGLRRQAVTAIVGETVSVTFE